MNELKNYSFTEQEFKQMGKLADDIYNAGIVLESFCEANIEVEEVQNIFPILKYLNKNADVLNCAFITYEK